MAKHRSPNCPQITFAEAIEKGRKVYEVEHTHSADKVVVAKDLGYSSLSGRSLALLGALRQYGILEGTGDALHVSKDAVAYYEMDDCPEKLDAVRRMAFSPDLFAELSEIYKGNLPSDGNLRHTLVSKGFSSKAAEDVIRVYKTNVDLVTEEEKAYSLKAAEQFQGVIKDMFQPSSKTNTDAKSSLNYQIRTQTYTFALSPTAHADLSLKGDITPEDLELLRDNIELTIKALTRKAKSETADK